MTHVRARIGEVDYAVTISARQHTIVSDEPPALGGQDAGLAPYDLLLGGLGACTAITLRMYAKRKQWPLQGVDVALSLHKDEAGARIDRVLTLQGDLDDEQRRRLLEIAEKTPVTLTLKAGTKIDTRLSAVAARARFRARLAAPARERSDEAVDPLRHHAQRLCANFRILAPRLRGNVERMIRLGEQM
jgi:putative redox protein